LPTEPWLRGDITGTDPVVAQVLYSFRQAEEELTEWTQGFTGEQIWSRPHDLASIGFHARHIAGSIGRLLTYAQGEPLSPLQFAELAAERQGGEDREALLAMLGKRLHGFSRVVQSFDPATFAEPRTVGRQQLPTTVGGLIVHISEHTQRHAGQAVLTAKVVLKLSQTHS